MIQYIKGNVFDTDCDIIAHGCNCRGGYGKGVARAMSKIHPAAKNAYLTKHRAEGWKLGDVQFVESHGKIIANCATQKNFWSKGKKDVLVSYWAVRSCMDKLFNYAYKNNLTVAMPKIGSGLAGGDWEQIVKSIDRAANGQTVKVYVL